MSRAIHFLTILGFVLLVFWGIPQVSHGFTACEISCGAPGTSWFNYTETCSDGSNSNTALVGKIDGYCVNPISGLDGVCNEISASMCCNNGARHTMKVHQDYWETSAACSILGDVCQCRNTSAGDCLGNPGTECKMIGTTCNVASDCCGGAVCKNGFCGTLGACLSGSKGCSCKSQCCSGVCNSGTCTGVPSCASDGSSCSNNSECCSGKCSSQSSTCVSNSSECFSDGQGCAANSDCCGECCAIGVCDTGGCGPQPPPVEICDDGIDNNSNGKIDCRDAACPPCCEMKDLTCPFTCTLGTNFTVNYFTKINSPYNPTILAPSYIEKLSRWPWGTECNQVPSFVEVINRNWYLATQTFACNSIPNIPNNINIDCDTAGAPVGCPFGTGLFLTCTVTPIAPLLPASKGFIKVRTPQGVRKLNLISVADAKTAGHGLVKVKTANPLSPFAADLVPTTDPGYYPIRVHTPLGTFKWRTVP